MSYIYYNANPYGRNTIDCVVRALSMFLGTDWDFIYRALTDYGSRKRDLFTVNWIWISYLKQLGYWPNVIPNTCPECYTLRAFCEDHPEGIYLVMTEGHVVAVVNGNYFDTWDSGDEVPLFYWKR